MYYNYKKYYKSSLHEKTLTHLLTECSSKKALEANSSFVRFNFLCYLSSVHFTISVNQISAISKLQKSI